MTVAHGTIAAEGRLHWLSERLHREGAVTIAAAAEALGVSEMTIRRDLGELEERGTARRVRGGARAIGPETFAHRRQRASRAKSRIAAKLVDLIPTSGVVAFDASSTVMRLAPLVRARDLTVLTNGPDTFAALQNQPGITPLLTGGRLDAATGSLVGPLACRSASMLSAASFFTSAAAVHERTGAMEATLEEAEVKRCLTDGARQVVLAVDATKLGAPGVALAIEWDRVDLLVTELDRTDERLAPFRAVTKVL